MAFPGPPALRYRPQDPKSWHFPCPNSSCQVPYRRYLRYPTHLTYSVAPRTPATPSLTFYGAEAARHHLPPQIAALALRYRISILGSSLWSNWCHQAPGAPPTGWSRARRVKPVTHPEHQSHDSHQIRTQYGMRSKCPSRNPGCAPEPLAFCSGISKDHMSFRGATSIDCRRA